MQIMDKYVQAGEALAWKESEVLDLTKQVTGLLRKILLFCREGFQESSWHSAIMTVGFRLLLSLRREHVGKGETL